MNLQEQGGLRTDGVLIIAETGLVGRPHLFEKGTAPFHHIGDAKGPADFDSSPLDFDLSPSARKG
jgi:hypothetical protein